MNQTGVYVFMLARHVGEKDVESVQANERTNEGVTERGKKGQRMLEEEMKKSSLV